MALSHSSLLSTCAAALCDVGVHSYLLQMPPWAESEAGDMVGQWLIPNLWNLVTWIPKWSHGCLEAGTFHEQSLQFFSLMPLLVESRNQTLPWVLEQSLCHWNNPPLLFLPSRWVSPSPKHISLPKDKYLIHITGVFSVHANRFSGAASQGCTYLNNSY